jgi:mono/diheme cytochrome c family protein
LAIASLEIAASAIDSMAIDSMAVPPALHLRHLPAPELQSLMQFRTRRHSSIPFILAVALAFSSLTIAVVAQQQTPAAKGDPEAAKLKNPIEATPESIAAGKKTFATVCSACHGAEGKGGIVLSVIEDKGGTQPPDLTDDKWDHGSSDGEIFTVIKKGVAPDFFMQPFDGRIPDNDIWSLVNYIKSLSQKK